MRLREILKDFPERARAAYEAVSREAYEGPPARDVLMHQEGTFISNPYRGAIESASVTWPKALASLLRYRTEYRPKERDTSQLLLDVCDTIAAPKAAIGF
jgi:hypothetical protein